MPRSGSRRPTISATRSKAVGSPPRERLPHPAERARRPAGARRRSSPSGRGRVGRGRAGRGRRRAARSGRGWRGIRRTGRACGRSRRRGRCGRAGGRRRSSACARAGAGRRARARGRGSRRPARRRGRSPPRPRARARGRGRGCRRSSSSGLPPLRSPVAIQRRERDTAHPRHLEPLLERRVGVVDLPPDVLPFRVHPQLAAGSPRRSMRRARSGRYGSGCRRPAGCPRPRSPAWARARSSMRSRPGRRSRCRRGRCRRPLPPPRRCRAGPPARAAAAAAARSPAGSARSAAARPRSPRAIAQILSVARRRDVRQALELDASRRRSRSRGRRVRVPQLAIPTAIMSPSARTKEATAETMKRTEPIWLTKTIHQPRPCGARSHQEPRDVDHRQVAGDEEEEAADDVRAPDQPVLLGER